MPKEFTIPPVVFNTGPATSSTAAPTPSTTTSQPNLQNRRPPSAPFQPLRPSSTSIPFMSFDITTATTTSSNSFPPHLPSSSSSSLFLDEPPLLEELEINPSLILSKTISLLNPFRLSHHSLSLHHHPDLSGPFLFYLSFSLFQLLAGKVQFGVILGWIAISSLFLYSILNFLAGRNGTLDLYRCFSVVGYCLMPIVFYSALSLFLPPTATPGLVVAAVFVVWATRVCSALLADDSLGASDHRGLIAFPCFLIYSLFSMLVMF